LGAGDTSLDNARFPKKGVDAPRVDAILVPKSVGVKLALTIRSLCLLLALALTAGLSGCGRSAVLTPPPVAAPAPVQPTENPDQARLKSALVGPGLSASEAAGLSDQMLAEGNPARNDEETMARLELVLLKALNQSDKTQGATLWRNLGIIHYRQKKYKQAQQELQNSNELNPRVAKTHFYLACLFAHQGGIFEKKGKKKISHQQFKRANIEMSQARKIEPGNPLYRQDIRQIISQENGK
jgi:tetratricopeptide (TPR) repeat protein